MTVIQWIQRRKEFKFLASVKLAVPLMLVVAVAVAWGTIVESKYNAEMAKITVYNADWFSVLMALLWINIFCATLARYPFKKHHTGFVITHIGLLMLLAGGVITTQYGIDGTLAVAEGQSDNMVSLPRLVFGIAPEGSMNYQTVEIPRTLSESEKFAGHNKAIGHIAEIKKYIPFASVNSTFVRGDSPDYALSFKLKSPFFDVAEFLHSRINPRKQMGPALFELKVGAPDGERPVAPARSKPSRKSEGVIRVLAASSGQTLHEISLGQFKRDKRFKFKDVEVELQQIFTSATVAGNKIAESGDSKPNPALELNVKLKGKAYREVLFARFPNFSLNREPANEYKLQFIAGENAPAEEPQTSSMDGQGHMARFYVDPKKPELARLELFKNNQKVLSQEMTAGQTVQTPWMGMQVTLASVIPNAIESNNVMAVEPQQREEIPPGAIEILSRGNTQSQWLTEGESKDIEANGRRYSAYFGRKMFRLPFQLNLQKFYKKDYPGTQTAMSFESDVTVGSSPQVHKISMNEPLYYKGYTLYQASYQLNPGSPAISVFSVNHDPGRQTKYLGSLILCLGIITFVIQRSSFYRNRQKRMGAS